MTDHIDYTTKPEVLAACGWCFDESEEEWVKGDRGVAFGAVCCDEMPVLTMQELWEGLCKACLIPGIGIPVLHEKLYITIQNGPEHHEIFKVKHFGTLRNTIAAALYWVLQQKGEQG